MEAFQFGLLIELCQVLSHKFPFGVDGTGGGLSSCGVLISLCEAVSIMSRNFLKSLKNQNISNAEFSLSSGRPVKGNACSV
jgi:hypothetical protein